MRLRICMARCFLVRPSAIRIGTLGVFVVSHDVSVWHLNRQEVTQNSERAEPPTVKRCRAVFMEAAERSRPSASFCKVWRQGGGHGRRQAKQGWHVGAVAKPSEGAASAVPAKPSEGAVSAGARGRGAPPPSASRESARRPRPVSPSTMGQGGAPRAELAAAASPIPSPYQGLGGKGLPAHLELVAVAILADLLTGKVLDVEPSVFSCSMPEPPHLEHEAFMLIIPLSDKMVEDSLERLTSRRGERSDSPCGQGTGPGWVTLR